MEVQYLINTIGFTRRNFLQLVADCSIEQMNLVPEGFKNNLVWNMAHMLSTQQMLCYEQSDTEPAVEQAVIDAYRPSTFPETFVDTSRLNLFKTMFIESVDQLAVDYQHGKFGKYRQRQTKYGILLTTIEEAISYTSSHEALHLGYARALIKLV